MRRIGKGILMGFLTLPAAGGCAGIMVVETPEVYYEEIHHEPVEEVVVHHHSTVSVGLGVYRPYRVIPSRPIFSHHYYYGTGYPRYYPYLRRTAPPYPRWRDRHAADRRHREPRGYAVPRHRTRPDPEPRYATPRQTPERRPATDRATRRAPDRRPATDRAMRRAPERRPISRTPVPTRRVRSRTP